MTQEDMEKLREHVGAMEALVPPSGGNIVIGPHPSFNNLTTIISGDRVGLIRLATAILRYALEATPQQGRFVAEAISLKDYFAPTSETRSLMVGLDDNPRTSERGSSRSFMNIVRGWFSGKRRNDI